MKSFPMFFRTTGRNVVIVGGGEQAAQKARLILKTDAHLVLVADQLDEELAQLVEEGRASQKTTLTLDVFENAAMAFVASGCPALDVCAHALAKKAGCPVNVVDQPELCDITTPSIVDRDPVVIAIGSEGTAPVLTRDIKTQLETSLPQSIGGLAALAGRLRPSVTKSIPRDQRRAFWAWVFKGKPRDLWTKGSEREAAKMVKTAIAEGKAPSLSDTGHISLVGAGPGARDLMTLRAVQRLQEADVIYYDRLVDAEVLELARRDAERVFVGKHVGAHSWPQEQINAVIVAEARKGRKVVRLKSGDPSIFGRAGEEIDAATTAGIPVDIVPGITAASAAAAALGHGLSERGVSDAIVLASGRAQDGDADPDATRNLTPGTTAAFYMSAGQATRIQAQLLTKGLPAGTKVEIAVDVSKPSEKVIVTTVSNLAQDIAQHGVTGTAVILVTWAKSAAYAQNGPRPMIA